MVMNKQNAGCSHFLGHSVDHSTAGACLGDTTLYNYQFQPLHRLGTQLTIRQ